jgi:hypothetical protein
MNDSLIKVQRRFYPRPGRGRMVAVCCLGFLLLAGQGLLQTPHLHSVALLSPPAVGQAGFHWDGPALRPGTADPTTPAHDPTRCPICQMFYHPLGLVLPPAPAGLGIPAAGPAPLPGLDPRPGSSPRIAPAFPRAPPFLA